MELAERRTEIVCRGDIKDGRVRVGVEEMKRFPGWKRLRGKVR